MKQQDRVARSRGEILQAALNEFGSREYAAVTVDQICSQYHISKGMLYHYYAGKDPLFLACVEQVFQSLAQLSLQLADQCSCPGARLSIRYYFSAREAYFAKNPLEKGVFESALLHTPAHLAQDIQRLRAPLLQANRCFFEKILADAPLRPGLDREQTLVYLGAVEESFWAMLRRCCTAAPPGESQPDLWRSRLLDLILFGVFSA